MRHELIREELAKAGGVRIRDLVNRLGVSRATVRRDLHALVDAGEAVNARGGALLPADRAHGRAVLEREALADAAAELIAADEVKHLGLFGGALIHELARRLADRAQLHVVTNSLAVARILTEAPPVRDGVSSRSAGPRSPQPIPFGLPGSYEQPPRTRDRGRRPQVTLLGGVLHPSGVMLGHPATDALAGLRLDATYSDCTGFDPRFGATVDNLDEADLRRVAIAVSDRACLLVERAQFGVCALSAFASSATLHKIVEAPGPPCHSSATL